MAVSGVDHFRLTTLGRQRAAPRGPTRPEAGPVRVVDDEADVGRAGALEDVVEEVALGVRVIEGRGNLDVVGPDARRGPDQPLQLQRGCCLAADRDRHPTSGGLDGRLPDGDALIERHGREVARRASGEQHRIARGRAAVDKEIDVSGDGVEVDRQVRVVVEHRRNRDVAALESSLGVGRVHRALLRYGAEPWI